MNPNLTKSCIIYPYSTPFNRLEIVPDCKICFDYLKLANNPTIIFLSPKSITISMTNLPDINDEIVNFSNINELIKAHYHFK